MDPWQAVRAGLVGFRIGREPEPTVDSNGLSFFVNNPGWEFDPGPDVPPGLRWGSRAEERIDMELIDNPVFIVFAVCSAVLCLKMIIVGHFTGMTRMRLGVYLNPEDAKAFSKKEEFTTVEHPEVERGLRAHRNDLESTLPFLGIGLVYVLVGPPVLLAKVLLIAFTALRCLFSLFYFRALQPWRSLSFLLAELCLVIMLVQILWWGLLS